MELRACIPRHSILHDWLDAQSILETPIGYDLVCGVSLIGALMRRDVWYHQIRFNVWPNTSVLLTGPSGSGKDTALNAVRDIHKQFLRVPIINGTTMEEITAQLVKMGHTAAGVLMANEMSALFGAKDYQSGIIQGLTNLLSSGDSVDVGLRSSPNRLIHRPTLTFMGGSTIPWLHEFMPKHTNEGGFYPRLLITVEERAKRSVPAVDQLELGELEFANEHMAVFLAGLKALLGKYQAHGRFEFANKPSYRAYADWYEQRHKLFSPIAEAYAHRSRDNCLRLAMISTMSRAASHIEQEDVYFATQLMKHVASRIDAIFAPPTEESRIGELIIKMLPAPKNKIFLELVKSYKPRDITTVFEFLWKNGRIKVDPDDTVRSVNT